MTKKIESIARKKSIVIWNIRVINKGTVTWKDCLVVAKLFGWQKALRLFFNTSSTALAILMS